MNDLKHTVQFWNWKEKRFDDLGTDFSIEDHMYDEYGTLEGHNHMCDVLNCGDNHYWATILDGEGQDLYFSPGFWRINRLGYVIYKSEHGAIASDYTV